MIEQALSRSPVEQVDSPPTNPQEGLDSPNSSISQSEFRIPETISELTDRFLNVPISKRIQDWADLSADVWRGWFQQESLAAGLQARQANFDEKVEGVSIIWNDGLFGWRGSEFLTKLNRFNPPAKRLFEGTYHGPIEFFQSKGYRVREVSGRFGLQTGDLAGTSRRLEEVVDEELYYSDLVAVIGHSFGSMVGHDYAARHPDKAEMIMFISGGAPYFPWDVNFWIAGSFLAINGTSGFDRLCENARFMQSAQALKIRFVNIVDSDDRVVDGPKAPGETRLTSTGHTGVYFDEGNLDFADSQIKSELARRRSGKGFNSLIPTLSNTAA